MCTAMCFFAVVLFVVVLFRVALSDVNAFVWPIYLHVYFPWLLHKQTSAYCLKHIVYFSKTIDIAFIRVFHLTKHLVTTLYQYINDNCLHDHLFCTFSVGHGINKNGLIYFKKIRSRTFFCAPTCFGTFFYSINTCRSVYIITVYVP